MLNIFKKINLNTILMIGIIAFLFLFLRQCSRTSNLKDDLKISKMNQIALNDSITTYKTKNGSLVSEKSILIASEKELKTLNKELYAEIKDLKDHPKIIIKEKIVVKHDTTRLGTKIVRYPDGKIGIKWDIDTTFSDGNFQQLAGETKFDVDTLGNPIDVSATLDVNTFGMSFTTGLTEDKDKGTYNIFIKSDYPGFTVTDIQGSIIDRDMITSDESSFVIGPSIGPGLLFNGSGVHSGIFVGGTVTWNLNKKIKKIFRPFGL